MSKLRFQRKLTNELTDLHYYQAETPQRFEGGVRRGRLLWQSGALGRAP
jgi:hypothetical protein